MLAGDSAIFEPSPEVVDRLIDDLGDPSASIADLARAHGTTAEALCLWMTQPRIAERLAQTNNITTWHTRLVASSKLHSAIGALTTILEDFTTHKSAPASPPAPRAPSAPGPASTRAPTPFQVALLAWRNAECARKSAMLLVRLGNLQPVGLPRPLAAPHAQAAPGSRPPAATPQPHATAIAAPAPLVQPPPQALALDLHPNAPTGQSIRAHQPEPQTPAPAAESHDQPAQPSANPPSPIFPSAPTLDFDTAAANLEDLLYTVLELRPELEPALERFMTEIKNPAPRPP
jgi:hypothetical protein